MIEQLFIQFLNMSLTGSAAILAVLSIRLLLKKAPKIFSYCLWAAVLFRLLCPVSFSAAFSPFHMLKVPSATQGKLEFIPQNLTMQPDSGHSNLEKGVSTDNSHLKAAAAGKPNVRRATWPIQAGAHLWLFGISILALSSAVSFVKLKRKLKTAQWEEENIYIAHGITTPFVIGIFHPAIYLPFYLKEGEKEYALLHEQIHLKRGDHIIKLLSFLALCLHWFNPLVWAAFFLSGKDMEMSCDEAVIRRIGNDVKKAYSNSLLSMATGKLAINGVPLAFGEGDTESRIKNILRYKKPAAAAVTYAALICIAAIVVLLANPSANTEAEDIGTKAASAQNTPAPRNLSEQQARPGATGQPGPQILPKQQGISEPQGQPDSQEPSVFSANPANDGTAAGLLGDLNWPVKRIFSISARSISKSARAIDSYVPPHEGPFMDGEPIVFDKDCRFMVNYSMDSRDYREVSFEKFAGFIENSGHNLNKPCLLGVEDNRVKYAALKSAWYHYGITPLTSVTSSYVYDSFAESADEAAFYKEYSLVSQENLDVADSEGTETIEVYTKNSGEDGVVLFKDAHGKVLAAQDASTSRAGWHNIYLGSTKDGSFILNVQIEDRLNYGAYSYQVYRLDKNGGFMLARSSEFEFQFGRNSLTVYDDTVFQSWIAPMEYYLKNSHLLLSSQDAQIRTEKRSDADKYNYAALSLKDRALELSAAYDGMLRFGESWYGIDGLPPETAEWLVWYNSLSERDRLSVNSIPPFLLEEIRITGVKDAAGPAG